MRRSAISTKTTLRGDQFSVSELNEMFEPLGFRERLRRIFEMFDEKEILVTSSFGTKSVFLLSLLSEIRNNLRVHFGDTGYHFKETIEYRDRLIEELNLEVVNVHPDPTQHNLTTEEEWWKAHPRMCCTINKIVPLEPIIEGHKIWISGLMAYQTEHRARLDIFEQKGDIIKFHPLLDIDEGEVLFHMEQKSLPKHPLDAVGYGSVGCTHCTVKGEGRSGRWAGTEHKECGLHVNYYYKDKEDNISS